MRRQVCHTPLAGRLHSELHMQGDLTFSIQYAVFQVICNSSIIILHSVVCILHCGKHMFNFIDTLSVGSNHGLTGINWRKSQFEEKIILKILFNNPNRQEEHVSSPFLSFFLFMLIGTHKPNFCNECNYVNQHSCFSSTIIFLQDYRRKTDPTVQLESKWISSNSWWENVIILTKKPTHPHLIYSVFLQI